MNHDEILILSVVIIMIASYTSLYNVAHRTSRAYICSMLILVVSDKQTSFKSYAAHKYQHHIQMLVNKVCIDVNYTFPMWIMTCKTNYL